MKVRKILPTWDRMSNIRTRRNHIVVTVPKSVLIPTDKSSGSDCRKKRLLVSHFSTDPKIVKLPRRSKKKKKNQEKKNRNHCHLYAFRKRYIFFNFNEKPIEALTGTKRFQKTLLVNKSSSRSSEENPFKSHSRSYVS